MQALARRQLLALDRDHWWFRGRRALYLDLLDHVLAGARPSCVLDLGAGPGGFAVELARRSGRVVALDGDPDMLAACRDRGVSRTVAASAAALPFERASFDLACAFDVLEHLDDDRGALREIARVLRPGGLLIASVPAYPWLFAGNDRVAQHRRRYTRRSLALALASAGFDVERNTHVNLLLFPLILPAVLVAQACERLHLSRAERTNLSWKAPRALASTLERIFTAERSLIRSRDLPCGHSLLAIARAPRGERRRLAGAQPSGVSSATGRPSAKTSW